jgi:hypothetical protein
VPGRRAAHLTGDSPDRNSPPHASGLEPQSCGGRAVASALASPLLLWSTRSNGRFVLGRSPVDRAHRSSRCRQNGVGRIGLSRQADPVWLVSAPPRKPSPAGREHPLGVSPRGVSEPHLVDRAIRGCGRRASRARQLRHTPCGSVSTPDRTSPPHAGRVSGSGAAVVRDVRPLLPKSWHLSGSSRRCEKSRQDTLHLTN